MHVSGFKLTAAKPAAKPAAAHSSTSGFDLFSGTEEGRADANSGANRIRVEDQVIMTTRYRSCQQPQD